MTLVRKSVSVYFKNIVTNNMAQNTCMHSTTSQQIQRKRVVQRPNGYSIQIYGLTQQKPMYS